ncbi:MAG: SufE family protein [Candidatus Melainabacteria bacterium]|jgi:cysteine desulfuration protein SufE|nr:SufE family protein [Candidatus Melainabacteria bacterium]
MNSENPFKLPTILLKRFNQFKKIQDKDKRFERIIQLGKRLESYPEELKTEENQVKGCASLTYISGKLINNQLQYQGWSNSHLVLGLLALLIEGINGSTPKEVLDINPTFIEAMGIGQTLTASRANGFMNTFNMMRAIAKQNKEEHVS